MTPVWSFRVWSGTAAQSKALDVILLTHYAGLALYRALLNASPKVPLPDDLAQAWGVKRHPIANLVRRAFLKNRADTSTRLVYPALKAGYRMLDTLSQATNPESPEYASILVFLRKRLAERDHVLLQKDLHPPNSKNPPKLSSAPNPKTVPLLLNTTPAPTPEDPNPKPTYAPAARPRPLSELPAGKKRRIPVLDMAREFPLLRLDKPQPELLNRVLTQKNKKRQDRLDMVREWTNEESQVIGPPDCEEEDDWEERVADLLDREIVDPTLKAVRRRQENMHLARPEGWQFFMRAVDELEAWVAESTPSVKEVTYKRTLQLHGIKSVIDSLTREREDSVARANAMRQIIADEKALAVLEKRQDHAERKKKWEARMWLEHGEDWKKLVAKEKRERDERRAARFESDSWRKYPKVSPPH
ncbi:hypothetical protein AB5N19_05700 [Seiridium cardinale]|uniref:Uncharacterized protein n=1 Tax=Seiridium cardinale TaxID=138064 RepID=A0ABR2XJA2_9PEZI